MEISKAKERLKNLLKDKRFVRIALLLGMGGIGLIYLSSWSLPEPGAQQPEQAAETCAGDCQRQLEEDLRRVVRAVTGEDSPEVMITLENAGTAVYAQDRRQSRQENGGEEETSHVILEDKEGAQQGLALSQEQPLVKGAVIVSRGAGDPAIREKLVNAACTVLGISSARVCVVQGW